MISKSLRYVFFVLISLGLIGAPAASVAETIEEDTIEEVRITHHQQSQSFDRLKDVDPAPKNHVNYIEENQSQKQSFLQLDQYLWFCALIFYE